jgi:hypothetical protein
MAGILELTSNIYLCVLEGIKNIAGLPDLCGRIGELMKSVCSIISGAGK